MTTTGPNPQRSTVFDKLDSNDPQRVADGSENLQYPSDLGSDEYNQFVLFTMFQKDTAEMVAQEKTIRNLERNLSELQNAEIAEAAARFAETWGLDPQQTLSKFMGAATYSLERVGRLPGISWWNRLWGVDSGPDAIDNLKNAIDIEEGKLTELRQSVDFETRRSDYFKNSTNRSAFTQFEKLGIKDRRNTSREGRSRITSAVEQVKKSIALYIPNKIVNNGSITYDNVDFDVINQASQLLKGNFSSLTPTITRKGAELADTVSGIFGANPNALAGLQAVSGLVINPRQQQIFQGVSQRGFDFTFSLAPQTPEEAVVVNKIIRAFREYSHPAIDSTSFFLKVPAEFEIRYYKIFGENGNEVVAENLFLNKIGRCALTSVNVDYTPNGINSTFHDGSPVRTTITMTFTELRPLTREDIEEGF